MATDKIVKYTATRFKADLKKGAFAPLYLFYGQEDYLVESWTTKLQQALLKPGDADFNLDILYGNETDGAAIVNAAMSSPMMAERRLVIVRDFHQLKEKSIKLLTAYAKNPSTSSCLVLTSGKLKGTNSIIKSLSKLGVALEAKPLYDNHVMPWITSHVKERGYSITLPAANLLHMNAGNSLRRLASEIDKVELLLKDRKEIDIPDIEAAVGASREFNIFEFADAVVDKNQSKSLSILRRLLELGESPIGMLVMLTRHYSIIAKAKEMLRLHARKDEMSKSLKVNPYFLDKYLRQAAKYNRSQIAAVIQLLLDADQKLKSSYQKPKLIIESLIFEINALH